MEVEFIVEASGHVNTEDYGVLMRHENTPEEAQHGLTEREGSTYTHSRDMPHSVWTQDR
jgi:hypothetical protein